MQFILPPAVVGRSRVDTDYRLGGRRGQEGEHSCRVHSGNRILLSQEIVLFKSGIFKARVPFLMKLHL